MGSEGDDESVSGGAVDQNLGALPALIGIVECTESDFGVWAVAGFADGLEQASLKIGGGLELRVGNGDFFRHLIHGEGSPGGGVTGESEGHCIFCGSGHLRRWLRPQPTWADAGWKQILVYFSTCATGWFSRISRAWS